MKTGMQWCLLLAAAFGALDAGAADPVYRCGDSYSSQPCPGGKAIQVDDPRSPQQRTENLEAVRKDAKAADEMQKARLKEEAKPAQALLPPPKAEGLDLDSPATSPGVARKPAYFTAVSPKKAKSPPEKKKQKAKKKSTPAEKASPAEKTRPSVQAP